MGVPFVDLAAIHEPLRVEILSAVTRVIDSQRFIGGPEVTGFEQELAAYCSTSYGVGVSSGTDALVCALMALGIGSGDEVITTPVSFFATAGAIVRVGARPVFVDIEAESFNINPDSIEAAITPQTAAIMPVHLFGRCANMDRISAIATKHNLPVIEDAAQAIGAEWSGRRAGSMGTIGCFSFFPAKNLGALGDGGGIVTDDEAIAERCRSLRIHGRTKPYVHEHLGGNFRLDAIQAAVLRVKLPRLEDWIQARQDAAYRYQTLFYEHGLMEQLTPPSPGPGRHVFNQYVIRIHEGRREEVFRALGEQEIGKAVYYPLPLHQQPALKKMGIDGDFPEAERSAADTLALPIAPGLTHDHQDLVVETIAQVLKA